MRHFPARQAKGRVLNNPLPAIGLSDPHPQGVLAYDALTGRILLADATAAQFLGYAPRDLAGRPVSALLSHPPRTTGTTSSLTARTRDGRLVGLTVTASSAVGPEGRPLVSLVLHPETPAQSVLSPPSPPAPAAAEDEARMLARTLAHDLLEPLRGMEVRAAHLEDEAGLSPDAREIARALREDAARFQSMVRDALVSGAAAPGAVPAAAVSLSDVLRVVLERLRDLAVESHAQIETGGALPVLHAPRPFVEHVLQNLVANALRHGGPNVRVRVSGTEEQDAWRITVEDSGPGISASLCAGHAVASPGGTGTGLVAVRWLVSRMGGTLECGASRDLGGARFSFTIPRTPRGSGGPRTY